MPEALNSFEKELKKHDKLVSKTPVGRTALINSINRLDQAGNILIASEDMGVVRFANQMHGVISQSVSLEVIPPLTDEQRQAFAGKLNGFELLMQANGDGDTPGGPTDPSQIPTDKAKG